MREIAFLCPVRGRPAGEVLPGAAAGGMDHLVVQVLVTVIRVMMMALMMPAR